LDDVCRGSLSTAFQGQRFALQPNRLSVQRKSAGDQIPANLPWWPRQLTPETKWRGGSKAAHQICSSDV
jgi:hypothetical protein